MKNVKHPEKLKKVIMALRTNLKRTNVLKDLIRTIFRFREFFLHLDIISLSI